MPLKYKKIILFFSLGILLIGLGTFSLLSPDFSFHFSGTHSNPERTTIPVTFGAIHAAGSSTETEIRQEINELVSRYYQAKQQVDMDTLAKCVSNISHMDEKKLMTEAEYVESYENIQCRIMDGATPGAYRVYVYYDVKIYDIDTVIPSLNALYLKQDSKNQLKIYLGALKSQEQSYMDTLDQSASVQELVHTVQTRLESVISADSEVRSFYEMLEGGNKNDSQDQ